MCILCLLTNLAITVVPSVKVVFLKDENDPINNSMKYSLFYCNVFNSTILSWEINGVGIGLFKNGNLENVLAGNKPNYSYSASLLSLRSNMGETIFNSVLIVSAPLGLPVHVNCVGDDDSSENTSNLATPMNGDNFSPHSKPPALMMKPIFLNSTIITDAKTRAFMCASNGTTGDQTWETDTNDHLALESDDMLGARKNRLTNSGDTLRLQAISLGQHHGIFVSILIVTDDSVSQVRCIAGNKTVEYPTDFITPATAVEGMLLYLILSRAIVLGILATVTIVC